MDNKNEDGLKLKNMSQLFQVLMLSMLPYLVLPNKKLFDVFFSTGAFCVSV